MINLSISFFFLNLHLLAYQKDTILLRNNNWTVSTNSFCVAEVKERIKSTLGLINNYVCLFLSNFIYFLILSCKIFPLLRVKSSEKLNILFSFHSDLFFCVFYSFSLLSFAFTLPNTSSCEFSSFIFLNHKENKRLLYHN